MMYSDPTLPLNTTTQLPYNPRRLPSSGQWLVWAQGGHLTRNLATDPDQATAPTTEGCSLHRGRVRRGESLGHSGKMRRKSSAGAPPQTNSFPSATLTLATGGAKSWAPENLGEYSSVHNPQ